MTDKGIGALKRRAVRYAVSDPELRGHWIRIQPSGAKSFWIVTGDPQHPIRPENRGRYPANWKEIRAAILVRA